MKLHYFPRAFLISFISTVIIAKFFKWLFFNLMYLVHVTKFCLSALLVVRLIWMPRILLQLLRRNIPLFHQLNCIKNIHTLDFLIDVFLIKCFSTVDLLFRLIPSHLFQLSPLKWSALFCEILPHVPFDKPKKSLYFGLHSRVDNV